MFSIKFTDVGYIIIFLNTYFLVVGKFYERTIVGLDLVNATGQLGCIIMKMLK